jgi:hypothetical protein
MFSPPLTGARRSIPADLSTQMFHFEVSTTESLKLTLHSPFTRRNLKIILPRNSEEKSENSRENENEPSRYCAQFAINGETKKSENFKLLRS